ncbi:dynein axonemal intermediate chain 4-like [Homalodisca vitripennis]|uniref:dynein axonemal intermediate chain 4-like n=1 Tax=Homalodisca vitripennis TaxID=197043 RepID=UPI001EEBB402|nr:dynein axonemal intermediate chain 4-like [Homalodisca vitripennis]
MSQTAPIEMSTSCVFASEWDLYDTYRRLSYEDEEAELDYEDLDIEVYGAEVSLQVSSSLQRQSITSDLSSISVSNELQPIIASRKANIQANKVMKLPEFQYAATVAERLLASNSFHCQQIAFMGTQPDSQEIATGFHYIMKELWTFSYQESKHRIVNAISWNTVNINVVAVGYGYVRGSEELDGLVCCWSVKNPSQPERVFHMRSPVTTISFSRTQPNLLALGCYNGAVIVLNIASNTGDKLVVTGEEGCLRYGPVGHLLWFFHTDFVLETEEIISVGKTGRVYKWNYTESYRSYEIMKLSYFQPTVKITTPKKNKKTVRLKNNLKYFNGLSVSLHPKKHMVYYVSTQEGSIIKCSMNHQDRFEDIFPAHAGPVYGVLHSPFCANIFCTYGSDWLICIWAEGLKEPLLKLYYTKQPVLSVAWSPIHSTILASISGHYLSMWDLARRTIVPISTVKSSTGNVFTSLQFANTGKNILAGDVAGDVFVFNLVDMPYPPFLQEEALIRALQKALVSKPQHRSYLENFMKTK